MSNIAISVENLSKKYLIGELERYYTIRDSLTHLLNYPLRLLNKKEIKEKEKEKEFIWALKDISFEVQHGEIVGIIGRNGAGKSTLLKILSRITSPTEGVVKLNGRVGSLLEVGTGFHPELTGRENIFLNGSILGMSKKEIERKFDEIVDFAEIEKFLDTPVKRYSSGMYVRLAFAVAAHMEPEILIVDEVLSVGDIQFQKKCLGKMGDVSKEGRTILFVSHNMGAISNLCKKLIVLDKGLLSYNGEVNKGIEKYTYNSLNKSDKYSDYKNPHIVYSLEANNEDKDFLITKIEILDNKKEPKNIVYTWDEFIIRIHYRCKGYVKRGSVVLEIFTYFGSRLLLLSTEPDGNFTLSLELGDSYIDCFINSIPLAAGDYIIGAGLAIPNAEWLYKSENLGSLTINEKDVYNSGLPPKSSRSLLAVRHDWIK